MSSSVIGGIEGGATKSEILLLSSDGQILATAIGPGTNHFLLGMTEVRSRIVALVNIAKKQARIPEKEPLLALGLALSGCEQEETNQELVAGFLKTYPKLSKHYAIGSDTQGSLACVSNKGGITIIAGTGSNTILCNPDGTKVQCGGWGHFLGDEGSAYYIAQKAIKYYFDDNDSLKKAPHSTRKVWGTIQDHFEVKSHVDLLPFFYTEFDKTHIAALCKKLADCANENDHLSKHIFQDAGEKLARSLCAVMPKASEELYVDEGLQILCVGSVWFSWNLLKEGFLSIMKQSNLKKFSLIKLTRSMSIGAAYMAADQLNLDLVRDYNANYEEFFKYSKCVCAK